MSSKRWMAEITYRDRTKLLFVEFEEIADLHDIVEMGPNIALFGPHVKIVQLKTSSPLVGDFHFAHKPAITISASSATAITWGCFSLKREIRVQ